MSTSALAVHVASLHEFMKPAIDIEDGPLMSSLRLGSRYIVRGRSSDSVPAVEGIGDLCGIGRSFVDTLIFSNFTSKEDFNVWPSFPAQGGPEE